MSFQWQDRDAAARTLGVDTHTLQMWIDDGRAPSRTWQGKIQVLIELLDEPGEPQEPQEREEQKERGERERSKAYQPEHQDQSKPEGDGQEQAERVHAQAATTDLELVSKRELQLAGGMVAAWQRLAETSNQDLARARKVGMLSWSLVAFLIVISGIGLWISTRSVTDAQGRLDATQNKLKDVEQLAEKSTKKADALQAEVLLRSQELAEANANLAATIERANLTRSQADAFAAQHLLTKQLADKQIETAKALADALQKTIDEQKERLAALEAQVKEARQNADALGARLAAGDRQIADQNAKLAALTGQRDEARTKIESLTADHAGAAALIDDLKKQLSAMKTEIDALKRGKEPTATAEKTGN